jgi:NitT/TauT family transport system substrate-binding protein
MYKNKFYQVMVILTVVTLVSSFLSACQPAKPEAASITIQLNFLPDPEFAGYYLAAEKGFFAEENLTVTFKPWVEGVESNLSLTNGEAEFAVLGMGEYSGLHSGTNVKPVALMALFQSSPLLIFSLAESGITKPQDLEGRLVASKGEFWDSLIKQAMTKTGADPDKATWVTSSYNEISKLYSGDVEVWPGFVTSEPVEAKMAGYEITTIYLGDYGVGTYEGLLVTTQEMLDQRPDVVERVVRAVVRGWQYMINNPEEASQITAKYVPGKSVEFSRAAIDYMIPLVSARGGTPFGWIDSERWKTELGSIYDPANPGFTTQYLNIAK